MFGQQNFVRSQGSLVLKFLNNRLELHYIVCLKLRAVLAQVVSNHQKSIRSEKNSVLKFLSSVEMLQCELHAPVEPLVLNSVAC